LLFKKNSTLGWLPDSESEMLIMEGGEDMEIGSKVHGGTERTEDYDEGEVLSIIHGKALVAWSCGHATLEGVEDLRKGHPGLWPVGGEDEV